MAKLDRQPDATDLHVTVCWSPAPQQVAECDLTLPAGSTVRDALQAVTWPQDVSAPDWAHGHLTLGIWNHKVQADHTLRDGDRVEIYRPLTVDPKVARRERFQKQGSRGAGLFAKRRAGAKAGY